MYKISVIGLGYIGFPLAAMLSKNYKVIGYDQNPNRIVNLNLGLDDNKQYSKKFISNLNNILLTDNHNELKNSDIFIITVPTPIDKNKSPDLSLLKKASKLISKYIKKNSIVILESTVYPGVTENICGAIIEKFSKLRSKKDFFLAYSPERMNPGDNKRSIDKITKVIGACDLKTLKTVSKIYASFLGKKIFHASSIKIAEAAKVIENTQRDINIAFMNEIKEIFDKTNIDTFEVLNAAKTKWNFLNFEPGLVGGHCIGVDPYYLAEFAKKNKIDPKVILSGRSTNEKATKLLFNQIKVYLKEIKKPNILVLGCTFKEDCPDIRNSKIIELCLNLQKLCNNLSIYDPWVNKFDREKLNFKFVDKLPKKENINLILIAVKHSIFKQIGLKRIKSISNKKTLEIIDYKRIFKT
ncbi:MAG: Vi polysaccharide biosynthesis protein VipA/TviB [Pelagibacteraceae bacterium]|nr:Vi polysaccharide biosynthesis protein VipA/TviB [Pelagibacteraceae bacterium]|tara:strand:- start:2733 stop:3965 length:1233 start_codon:yes stop_codon:yes gene_type:complete